MVWAIAGLGWARAGHGLGWLAAPGLQSRQRESDAAFYSPGWAVWLLDT